MKENMPKYVARKILLLSWGGTGQEIAFRVRKGLEKLPNGKIFPCQIRIFDTDLKSTYFDTLNPYFVELNVSRAELIQRKPEEFPHISNHLRIEEIPSITSTPGADQFISQGKLLFVASLEEVIGSIRTAIKPLLSPQLGSKLREVGVELVDDRIYIFVVRSLAGGVGSSVSDELIWLLHREMMKLLHQRSKFILIDIMLRPEVFEGYVGDLEKIQSNAAASIWMKVEYNDKRTFEIIYGEKPDLQIKLGGERGADLNFLISNRNLSGETDRPKGSGCAVLSLEEIYEICANFILLHFTPVMGSFYDIFANREHESINRIRGQLSIFSSFGLIFLKFPTTLIRDFLKVKFSLEVLKYLKGGEDEFNNK